MVRRRRKVCETEAQSSAWCGTGVSGRIRMENGTEVFFHATEMQNYPFDSLQEGQAVTFEIEQDTRGCGGSAPSASRSRARPATPPAGGLPDRPRLPRSGCHALWPADRDADSSVVSRTGSGRARPRRPAGAHRPPPLSLRAQAPAPRPPGHTRPACRPASLARVATGPSAGASPHHVGHHHQEAPQVAVRSRLRYFVPVQAARSGVPTAGSSPGSKTSRSTLM